jgi:hypothetical protein
MMTSSRIGLAACGLALSLAGCSSTGPDDESVWGSDQASLRLTETSGTLRILDPGSGCYGSYGEIAQPISSLSFTLPGTYTQLTGVFPGHADYPAQFSGTLGRGMLTLSVSIPALQRTLGPFHLTVGLEKHWAACLYP